MTSFINNRLLRINYTKKKQFITTLIKSIIEFNNYDVENNLNYQKAIIIYLEES
jgi:hypothetical protein